MRRAGIGLADIQRFLAAPAAGVIDGWMADLAAEAGVRRRALEALAFALGLNTSLPQEPAIRHGYQTMLLLQWIYDPGRFDAEVEAPTAGPLRDMVWHRESFGGVPQLFVDLDEPSPVVRAQVQDLVCGAHVGYCMTKAIRAQAETRS